MWTGQPCTLTNDFVSSSSRSLGLVHRPDMYLESCVRPELPHEGPSFSAKYAGPRGFLCSQIWKSLRIDNMFKWRSQWKSHLELQQSCDARLVSSGSVSRALVNSSHALSPLLSFWSSVSRAIVFSSCFLSFSLRRRQGPRRPH